MSAVQKRSKRKNRGIDLTKPVERPRMPLGIIFRMFVLGSIATFASGYAIYRHYFVPRPSMLRPVPSATSTEPEPLPPDVLPVPELVPLPPPLPPPPAASSPPSPAPSR